MSVNVKKLWDIISDFQFTLDKNWLSEKIIRELLKDLKNKSEMIKVLLINVTREDVLKFLKMTKDKKKKDSK